MVKYRIILTPVINVDGERGNYMFQRKKYFLGIIPYWSNTNIVSTVNLEETNNLLKRLNNGS